ncbi:MAG TPA: hypothetical protein VFD32_15385 [Dehalococcoidia bacterium]|nr:hypothetical protein [Dehalococcoidia bacterium]
MSSVPSVSGLPASSAPNQASVTQLVQRDGSAAVSQLAVQNELVSTVLASAVAGPAASFSLSPGAQSTIDSLVRAAPLYQMLARGGANAVQAMQGGAITPARPNPTDTFDISQLRPPYPPATTSDGGSTSPLGQNLDASA